MRSPVSQAKPDRPQKITFAEMRNGRGRVARLLRRLPLQPLNRDQRRGDAWPDDTRLSDIEERFTCRVCGKRGADVRPDFNWNRKQVSVMGYR